MAKGKEITSVSKLMSDTEFKSNLIEVLAILNNNIYALNVNIEEMQKDLNVIKNNIVFMNISKK